LTENEEKNISGRHEVTSVSIEIF